MNPCTYSTAGRSPAGAAASRRTRVATAPSGRSRSRATQSPPSTSGRQVPSVRVASSTAASSLPPAPPARPLCRARVPRRACPRPPTGGSVTRMTSEILARVDDGVGHLTLDRPRALNALGYSMLGEIADVLEEWRVDPTVRLVLLDGAGDRGLCAGGDIRELHASVVAGRQADARRYFRREYAVDAALAELPVPVVTIMDGITMGGGVGLAAHAPVRVVTERSRVAMPETRIGFTPDVGGSWLLARAPGRLGEHLALGAVTMDGADAIHAGDRKSTRLNSSHLVISYAVFCLKK